ncbi:serine hydrolase domain-containing protein [Geofilum sp. OHC36d9]|uniref:serine hydrolase domain-containing protein n=1 Tax=Geofilum sp. OHC36d9 TaxID=3458413 RepID=UPI0040345B69
MSFKYKTSLVVCGLVGGVFLDYLTGPSINTFGTDFIPSLPVTTSAHISGRLSSDSVYQNIDKQVKYFINRWDIAGASVAIARDGKLVFAKGYGWIDKENKTPAEPYNLFRVASISKLITATGIMKLVEDGKLKLDDKVFGPKGILSRSPFDHYKDKGVEDIEVLHLLNHSGGWTTRWGDPMFMPYSIARQTGKELPLKDEDIIEFMLSKRLHFKPGTMAYYSNLGYVVLGKVIEEVTGQDYESYIKTQVLYPLGIYDMQLGGSFPDERLPLESKYYEPADHVLVDDYLGFGEKVPGSYGGNDIHTLGAAGGWVASSTDLLKLMLSIDGESFPADILTPESIQKMATPSNPGNQPLGWRAITSDSWYRTGTLAGTSAIMVRQDNGISYVVLFNTSTWKGPALSSEIRHMMKRAIGKTDHWMNTDLFQEHS